MFFYVITDYNLLFIICNSSERLKNFECLIEQKTVGKCVLSLKKSELISFSQEKTDQRVRKKKQVDL